MSFTKTAAQEIGSRIGNVHASTLHSHCWQGLERPPIAEVHVASNKTNIDNFVPWNQAHPNFALSRDVIDLDSDIGEPGDGAGDELLAKAMRWRSALIPREHWPDHAARVFADKWDDWKEQHGLFDFTDLIEYAEQELAVAPGAPNVILTDECQDFTPAQLRLIRRWGEAADWFFEAGDDDQTLYSWAGCDPQAFINPPLPAEQMIVLEQSYRVPRAVHERAERWIKQVSVRQEKVYRPRDADGRVLRSPATWREPYVLAPKIQALLDEGQSVMLLASCGYMLQPTLKMLREHAIPFANPWRIKAGNWNPMRSGAGTGAAERIAYFLLNDENYYGEKARLWSPKELFAWSNPLKAEGVFIHGAKTAIEKHKKESQLVTWEQLAQWFTEDALNHIWDADLDWYMRSILATKRRAFEFPLAVLRKRGLSALLEKPRLYVGSIHSFKGAEADNVILFPDLSLRGYNEGWTGKHKDEIRRAFYVAATRARDTLVIAHPVGHTAVSGL
jgi:DNA helicase-2/ATP-dependent DNA helicase PcrA